VSNFVELLFGFEKEYFKIKLHVFFLPENSSQYVRLFCNENSRGGNKF
jgi:hypothetical protein